MVWWQHLFALLVLAHMLWAVVRLQREWKRDRRQDGLVLHPRLEIYPERNVEGVQTHAK
jgi:hypothetical protein